MKHIELFFCYLVSDGMKLGKSLKQNHETKTIFTGCTKCWDLYAKSEIKKATLSAYF